MDLGKLAGDELGKMLGSNGSTKKKKTTSPKKSYSNSVVDGIVDNIDDTVKSKLPKGAATDIVEDALDQNKDGHIVDDLLRRGNKLFKSK